MDHLLPVQLVELQNVAADLAETVIAPLAAEVDADCRWPAHSLRALGDAGLLGLGGSGYRCALGIDLSGLLLARQ